MVVSAEGFSARLRPMIVRIRLLTLIEAIKVKKLNRTNKTPISLANHGAALSLKESRVKESLMDEKNRVI
jgi:hypothetical protein